MAPREFQLQSIGFLRHFSPSVDLNNVDPDFVALERAFESGAAFGEQPPSGTRGGGQPVSATEEDSTPFSESSDEDLGLNPAPSRKHGAKASPRNQRKPGSKILHADDSATPRTSASPRQHRTALVTHSPPYSPDLSPDLALFPHKWKRTRKHQLRKWSLAKKAEKATKVHPTKASFEIKGDSRISKPAWMGLRASVDLRKPIEEAVSHPGSNLALELFKDLTRAPYLPHLALAVVDGLGRLFLYRSRLTPMMMADLLPKVNALVPDFVSAITRPFSNNDMLLNSRGEHWFSIAGHDRNNKSKPAATQFQQQNHQVIAGFFTKGSVLERLTAYGCDILKAHFPVIAQRYQDSIDYMLEAYGIQAMFDLTSIGKTWLLGCHFNHHEKCWLVIWEAGIVVELPPGVFLFYPSSLFLHFNIDVSDLPVFTTQHGETPTRENSTPLSFCSCNSHKGNRGWEDADGRGSMVWFNQASMIQTSELGVPTIEYARGLGMNTKCDGEGWFTKGAFPVLT
ncbi:hypothetical protein C8R41DRAFT_919995 [Lentinula lateritia]|uniref:Uncharacterized protein n=1 Tax=Lentinula lateritia TaxID=40482 RepID=A0ABQ8VH29_9AGAR|nr:hypothetical protein C8R41DRAFT_919995 [Lentinula lateritia]